MDKDEAIKIIKYSDKILEIIDNRDNFTRGDLQGVVAAVVMKIINETRNQNR